MQATAANITAEHMTILKDVYKEDFAMYHKAKAMYVSRLGANISSL